LGGKHKEAQRILEQGAKEGVLWLVPKQKAASGKMVVKSTFIMVWLTIAAGGLGIELNLRVRGAPLTPK